MSKYALDSNIVSYYLKGDARLIEMINDEARNERIVIPPVVYYEVKKWLLKNKSRTKLAAFEKLFRKCGVETISRELLDRALAIYIDLQREGITIDDADILIGAYCLQNDYVLVTNNDKHFRHIKFLWIENWTKTPAPD